MRQRTRVDDAGNTYVTQWADADYPREFANEDAINAALAAGVDALEARLDKAAWNALTTAQRWQVVRGALVLLAKLMRRELARLDTAGGDDSLT